MSLKSLIPFFFILFFISSCTEDNDGGTIVDHENIIGTWFGGSYQLDEDYYLPMSNLFQFKEKDILVRKKIGQVPNTLSYSVKDASFSINEKKVEDAKISKDEVLSFKQGIPSLYFKKINPSEQELSNQLISDKLGNKYWKKDNEILSFDIEKELMKKYDLIDSTYSDYCFNLDSFENNYFISKKGNFSNCKSNRQFLEQIVSISEEEFEVLRWEEKDNDFKRVKYKTAQKGNYANYESATFQLCNKYLNANFPNHRYYAVDTKYQGGIYQITKIFNGKYIAPTVKEDGLIRVRFIVNCEGQTGRFELLEMDNNYKEKKFNEKISMQILELTKSLDGWIAGKRKDKFVDSYKFLTFKIKDSEIVEIFP